MKNTSIVYAIQGSTLFKIGTYSNKTAIKLIHDKTIIDQYGPLVAISTDDGTILQYMTVEVLNQRTMELYTTEHFFDEQAARHYACMMNYKGYIVKIY